MPRNLPQQRRRHASDRASAIAAGALAAVALSFAGCGEDSSVDPASLVPPDTPFYAEAVIRPEGERADAISAITDKVAGIDAPGQRIIEELDQELAVEDGSPTYAEDIEPWLGETAAIFVRSAEPSALAEGMPDGAAIIEITDADAAQRFVDATISSGLEAAPEQSSYEGVDYTSAYDGAFAVGLVGDFLVFGTESSLTATVDVSDGESLAESDDFADEVGSLGDDELAAIWLDLGTLLSAAAKSSAADAAEIDAARAALGPILEEPMAMSLAASADAVSLDVSSAGEAGISGDAESLGALPADAWFAVAIEEAGAGVREAVSALGSLGSELGDPALGPEAIAAVVKAETGLDLDEDILGWIGDAAFYVAGTSVSEISLGAIVGTDDAERSLAAIDVATRFFERDAGRQAGPPRLADADGGFAALAPTGQGIELAQRGDQVVVAVGGSNPATEALEPERSLADDEAFEAASSTLGDDFTPAAYLAMQPALVVAEAGGSGLDPDFQAARPYLDALSYLVLGTSVADGRTRSRVVLGIGQ